MPESRGRRRKGWLVLFLLCAPAALSCDWMARVISQLREPRISPPPTSPKQRPDLRAAMLSVYYHAYGLDLLEPPPPGEPIPLVEAAQFLADDASFGASARRRRAISKLAAAHTARRSPGATEAALDILVGGAFSLPQLFRELQAADPGGPELPLSPLPLPPGHIPVPVPPPIPLPISVDALRERLAELIATTLHFLDRPETFDEKYSRVCCSGVLACEVRPAYTSTSAASVYFRLNVRRSVQEMRKFLDPQNWEACAPEYFQSAYYQGDKCSDTPSLSSSFSLAPVHGSGWDGVLYEHFQTDFDYDVSTWFKNRLQICGAWDASGEAYHYHYGLCRPGGSLSSSVLNDGPVDGGLEQDCGLLRAWDQSPDQDDPDVSLVEGVKTVQFSPRTPDPGAGLWANLGLEELVDELADTGVCCGYDDSSSCSAPDEQCLQGWRRGSSWPSTPLCKAGDPSPPCDLIDP